LCSLPCHPRRLMGVCSMCSWLRNNAPCYLGFWHLPYRFGRSMLRRDIHVSERPLPALSLLYWDLCLSCRRRFVDLV
jgi:hypothetical protein